MDKLVFENVVDDTQKIIKQHSKSNMLHIWHLSLTWKESILNEHLSPLDI